MKSLSASIREELIIALSIYVDILSHFTKGLRQTTIFFSVLGFELRAYILSHSTSIFCDGFFSRLGLMNYLPGLASKLHLPDLCLLSS
jgi:hypothetical protein